MKDARYSGVVPKGRCQLPVPQRELRSDHIVTRVFIDGKAETTLQPIIGCAAAAQLGARLWFQDSQSHHWERYITRRLQLTCNANARRWDTRYLFANDLAVSTPLGGTWSQSHRATQSSHSSLAPRKRFTMANPECSHELESCITIKCAW